MLTIHCNREDKRKNKASNTKMNALNIEHSGWKYRIVSNDTKKIDRSKE